MEFVVHDPVMLGQLFMAIARFICSLRMRHGRAKKSAGQKDLHFLKPF
jgi:hypothetical protein